MSDTTGMSLEPGQLPGPAGSCPDTGKDAAQIQTLNMSPEVTALLRRKLELKRKKLEILRRFGLLSYQPHPKQDKFHRAGKFRRRMVRAGNRFGKSKMGCAEDIAWTMGERVWYNREDPARKEGLPQRPVKGLIITTDFDVVDEVWTSQRSTPPGKVWQLMPPDFVKRVERNSNGVIDHVFCQNGSSLTWNTVKSWQNDPQSLESTDWDFIHVDEPCPEKMWKAASRGLIDRDGFAWFTLTPLKEVWINDMFFPRRMRDGTDPAIAQGSKWAIQGSIYDNPFLSVEAIKEYESSLTEDERQCRIHGLPLDLSGLIYKQFDYDRHVLKAVPKGWRDYHLPPLNYTVYAYIDPHPQTPHAILFLAVSPLGQKFFYHEIFKHCTIKEISARITDAYAGYYVARVRCDPLAYIKDPITDTTIAEEFATHGVFVEKAPKDLATGILRAQEELAKGGPESEDPQTVYFSPRLMETLWEFERYVWDDDNKPLDENDHMMENFYRSVLDKPRWIDAKRITNSPVEDMVIDRAETNLEDLKQQD